MSSFVFANFFQTTLRAAATSSQTTIQVASATGAPTIGTGEVWAVVLQSAATATIYEVVYVTAITSTTFTVLRAQEGTVAQAWNLGDNVFAANTAGQMAYLEGLYPQTFAAQAPPAITTTYVLAESDAGKFFPVTAAVTVTLGPTTIASGETVGFWADGANVTLTTSSGVFKGGVVDGSTSITIPETGWLFVQTDGTDWKVVAGSPNLLSAHGEVTITSSGNWTVPNGVVSAFFEAWGGGGGGAGNPVVANTANAGNGGSGAYGKKYITGLVPGSTIAMTIGAGGTAGAFGGNNGGTGGSTSVGSYFTVAGGTGGLYNSGAGAAGGAAPTGVDIGIAGMNGTTTIFSGSTPLGIGGTAPRGGGGGQAADVTAGVAGNAPGGGGGCGISTTAALAGAPGSSGWVIVRW